MAHYDPSLNDRRGGRSLSGSLFFPIFAGILLLVVPATCRAQSRLLVISDLDCDWELDGQPQGTLQAEQARIVELSLGSHLVQASSLDRLSRFSGIVDVGAAQALIAIHLKQEYAAKSEADLRQHLIWADPQSGLMWASKGDAPTSVTVQQAGAYCQRFSLGGYSDWRLPKLSELAAVVLSDRDHGEGGMRLTTWFMLHGTPSKASKGDRFILVPGDVKSPDSPPDSFYFRGLCVRRSAR